MEISTVVNGAATTMMVVFIDPQMSVMTDDVVEGRTTATRNVYGLLAFA